MFKSKREQIAEQEKLILQKRKELEDKKTQSELLEKLKSNSGNSDQTTSSQPFLPNDGSFLENFKKLTQQGSSSTNQSVSVPQMNAIPSQSQLEITNDLSPLPTNLKETTSTEIQVIKIDDPSGSSIKIPSSKVQLIELVAVNGDGYEENLRTQCRRIELCQEIRFIFEKDCHEYRQYRKEVTERRTINKSYDEIEAYRNKPSRSGPIEPKIFGSTQESKTKTVTIIRNDDSESTNSDTDTWKEAKERNLKNLKRKVLHVRRKKQFNVSTTDSSEDNQQDDNESRRYERKHKMSSASSSSSANSKKDNEQQENQLNNEQQDKSSDTCSRPKRKKSRWGEAPQAELPPQPPTIIQQPMTLQQTVTTNNKPPPSPMLSTITRTDPLLLQYARQNFGTTNLSEEDWKKAEEHYKINLLFQDMQRKRQEIEKLAKNGKFKYEYDSDEEINGGTWEHKIRASEMEATLKWAEALNKQCEGKHHIGDFLPPEELKKFMEKYNSEKSGGEKAPDVSDYKDFKLKEDNKGYQMLQKMGWKGEGTSLGSTGSGITEPINKAPQLAEHQGLGANQVEEPNENDDEYDAYRKRMMLAYRFRPNPLNNPRRAYY